ncbi:MAG: ATP-binding protein [Maribacter sp.]|nr:ATP-binding protein [Maribacter sp.]
MIVFVFGLPGTGKSYFASRLAKMIDASYVNSDRLRKDLFDLRTYASHEKKVVYETMLDKAKKALAMGQNLVLDATFHKKETRDAFMTQLSDQGEVYYIELHAAESIIKERLKKSRPYSEADFEVYKLIQLQWEPFSREHLMLESTNTNIEEMLLKAAQYLGLNNDTGTDK